MDDDGSDTSVWTVGLVVGWWVTAAVILAYVPYPWRVTVWRWLHVLLFVVLMAVATSPSLTVLIGLGISFGISLVIGSEVLKAKD